MRRATWVCVCTTIHPVFPAFSTCHQSHTWQNTVAATLILCRSICANHYKSSLGWKSPALSTLNTQATWGRKTPFFNSKCALIYILHVLMCYLTKWKNKNEKLTNQTASWRPYRIILQQKLESSQLKSSTNPKYTFHMWASQQNND